MIFTTDESGKIPIKSWCEHADEKTVGQLKALADHPTTVLHVAAMPDAHAGLGMPIGGVIACKDAVIPSAVGVDIGCGMCAVRTDYQDEITEDLASMIMDAVLGTVPVGFAHNQNPEDWVGMNNIPNIPLLQDMADSTRKQIGTLGGGNHFIELQKDQEGFVWLMVHSGSRNFGYRIAGHYMEMARKMCLQYHSSIDLSDKNNHLAFLPQSTDQCTEYLQAMNCALDFAHENRDRIMSKSLGVLGDFIQFSEKQRINIHHNFVASETHFGKEVWVHRKGATQAFNGWLGIIPGSMGTASYIVEGRGNRDSFMSCSHGAGRRMGRKDFMRRTKIEECEKAIVGVAFPGGWSVDRKGTVDYSEAPQAYKDIDEVIAAEDDLVKVVHKLTPLGVAKG